MSPLRITAVNPVRNSSPAIAGLETERGIISNGVNSISSFVGDDPVMKVYLENNTTPFSVILSRVGFNILDSSSVKRWGSRRGMLIVFFTMA